MYDGKPATISLAECYLSGIYEEITAIANMSETLPHSCFIDHSLQTVRHNHEYSSF